jgi:transcription termination/antitermination protein NusA
MSKEIIEAVRVIEKEKGIDGETLIHALEDALLAAYKKTPGASRHATVELDNEGDFRVYSIELPPDIEERLIEEARERAITELEALEAENGERSHTLINDDDLDIDWSEISEDQVKRADVTPHDFGRIAAQTAKQVILQRIREAEREMMYDEYVDRVTEVVTGIVQQAGDRNNVLVDLGKVEALLPRSEQVDGERYEQGSRIKAVITEVRSGTKGPQVILSRRDPELIRTLFELEVPEIADGLVEIRGVAREPGYRSKIAVESHAQGVDPVGACVGPRGSRVRMVVSELRGEKIDIIPWNTEPARFIAKALSPARVREVLVDDETKEATVIVPEDQLALAIGKEGLNARLAARLTGWKVDIQSDAEFAQAEAEAAFAGGTDGEEFSGRCIAILANGKRCPNTAIPGSRFCGIPAHRALAEREAAGEELEASQVVGGVSDEVEEAEAPAEEPVGDAEAQEEVVAEAEVVAEEAPVADPEEASGEEPEPVEEQAAEAPAPDVEEPQEAPVEPEVPIAVEEGVPDEEDRPAAEPPVRDSGPREGAPGEPGGSSPTAAPPPPPRSNGSWCRRVGRGGRRAVGRVSSGPTRTCTGCGRKAPKGELIRFVARDGVLTPGAKEPGRGVYTCRRLQCFERAVASRGFTRTLRTPVRVDQDLARLYTTEGRNG